VKDEGPVNRKHHDGNHELDETVVTLRIDGADDVVVDEPALVGMIPGKSSKRLLKVGERTIEADRHAHERNTHGNQVWPDQASPSPSKNPANGNERQIDQVHDNHEFGEHRISHRLDRTADARPGFPSSAAPAQNCPQAWWTRSRDGGRGVGHRASCVRRLNAGSLEVQRLCRIEISRSKARMTRTGL
jgi:hypothetical protein